MHGYNVEIYKSKIDTKTLNTTLLNVANILENNEETYEDNFPIKINPTEYTITQEKVEKWLESNKLEQNLSAEEVLYKYKEKYEIDKEDIGEIRKIIGLRYGIEKNGYSSMKPYVIAKNISSKTVSILEEQNAKLPGISIEVVAIRQYPNKELASHILGYVGKIDETELKQNQDYNMNDYIGKTGIEYVFEKYLKGTDGEKQTDMAIDGTMTAEYTTKEAVAGNDVVLTIDAKLQEVSTIALKNNIEKIQNGKFGTKGDANAGAVAVIDVNTGEILSLVSYPDYDPNLFVSGITQNKWDEYTQEGNSALINRTIQSAYAPGSIFKMVGAIAGLETGKITPTETIVDTGIYPNGHKPRCWIYATTGGGHGALNVSGAIQHSCNYFFYEVGTRIGIDTLEEYSTKFGLGQKTNIELPGEISGTLAGKKLYEKLNETWYYGNTLSAVIGQAENNFTPLQIAKYISMLVNGGKDIDLTLIKSIVKQNGEEVEKSEIAQYLNERLGLTTEEKEDLNLKKENIRSSIRRNEICYNRNRGNSICYIQKF